MRQTEDPEHEAHLDVGHENVCRSERGLDDVLDGLGVELRVYLVSCQRLYRRRVHAAHVERDRVRRAVQTERSGSQQEQEAHV